MNILKHTLTGPVTISHLVSPDGNMNILLLGDKHVIAPKCGGHPAHNHQDITDIDVWLSKLFDKNESRENNNNPIDFILEAHYLTDNNDEPHPIASAIDSGLPIENYIYKILHRFKDCFTYQKNNCIYRNTRFHSTDIRLYEENERFSMFLTNEGFLHSFIKDITWEDSETEWIKLLNINIVNPLRRLLKLWNTKNIDAIIESLRQTNPLHRENLVEYYLEDYKQSLERVLQIKITNENDNYVENFIDDYCKNVRARLLHACRRPTMRNSHASIVFGGKDRMDGIFQIDMLRMDILTMSTVFNSTLNMKRVIIYAGNVHITNYLDILLKSGFTRVFSSISKIQQMDNFQCHDISYLKWK
jgi:hypothetical protein